MKSFLLGILFHLLSRELHETFCRLTDKVVVQHFNRENDQRCWYTLDNAEDYR